MPKAVIVGGSIMGLSCTHALLLAGWEAVVLEKSGEPPNKSPTGAGLGLDPTARRFIEPWISQPEFLDHLTLPLSIDQTLQNEATDPEKKVSWTLTRDEDFSFRAAHWADLHGLLHPALPPETIKWGHLFLSFTLYNDRSEVSVKAQVLHKGDTVEITGNLLVAADGCLPSIRQTFLPELKLRYSGYCAWRGVLDFSGQEDSETIIEIKKAYPDLGKCLYFDLSSGTHSVLYELLNKRLNWIWISLISCR
ncbi:FAD-dependent monooxygenase ptmM-like isoform X2 [Punica granatum]|uniref:FAD-dependent monooxygenase ptmM-like isoform X2 n=1 Tax=Punica granatum TaxID=22663 RepID=A0A6P8BU00_PUNGR|nr:FAD-dependent monooxygenase ptmM-like isoform X2 [Punica granatum]